MGKTDMTSGLYVLLVFGFRCKGASLQAAGQANLKGVGFASEAAVRGRSRIHSHSSSCRSLAALWEDFLQLGVGSILVLVVVWLQGAPGGQGLRLGCESPNPKESSALKCVRSWTGLYFASCYYFQLLIFV